MSTTGADQDSATDAIDVDPAQLSRWLEHGAAQVIDVREAAEREAGHIDGSRHIELLQLTAAAESIDRDLPVVFYCRVGERSTMAAQAFRAAGYQAHSLRGGLARWAQEGHPLSPEGGHVADH
jgi:rhodanese-related sulfurtransferase